VTPAARWGVVALLLIGTVDVVTPGTVVLLPVLGVAPLLAASDGPPRNTLLLGIGASALAFFSGSINGFAWSIRHTVGIVSTIVIALIAWRLAVFRSRREEALRDTHPHVERSLRLASAMAAGEIGEWWYDVRSGIVRWDDATRRLFGLLNGSGGGRLDELFASVAGSDRGRIEEGVMTSARVGGGFRGDHRVNHPDGSTRWIELVGESLVEDGRIVGVVGLVQSTEERHREIEERDRLLDLEADARRRAEFLDRMHKVLNRSVDAEEILQFVTRTVVPDLADCAVVAITIDRADREPLVVVHHRDPSRLDQVQASTRSLGLEMAMSFAADLTRSRVPDVAAAVDDEQLAERRSIITTRSRDDGPQQARWSDMVDAELVISLPIVGPLGLLGVLHLVRDSGRRHPAPWEIELAEEVASRLGSALNTAIIYGRLLVHRGMLQALQTVTGELAGAATSGDVTRAILGEGRKAVGASGAALFLVDRSGSLRLEAVDGVKQFDDLEELAECALRERRLVDGAIRGTNLVVVAVPLSGSQRNLGVLQFMFEEGRLLTDGEIAMVTMLGSRAAAAVERAATYDRDHDVALVLQRRLLPDLSNTPPWLQVAAHYEPATGGPIGGDWYQLVDLGDGRVAAVVGDAVGHGLVSAAAMGQLRAAVTTALTATHDPAAALRIVDRFADLSPDTVGASLGVALIDETGRVLHASAGHPPLVIVPRSGPLRMLERGRRPLLGYGADADTEVEVANLALGDTLVLYSDGLIERRRRSFDTGLHELREILDDLRDRDVDVICREVIDRMSVHADAEDDVAVMVLRHVPVRSIEAA
jgi:GAF domain-containing protein/PAS domain-containing protein